MDYMAVLPAAILHSNSTTDLESVKYALAQRFPNTNVSIRNPAVVVGFGTEAGERHEITLGYFIETVGGSNVYGISNRAGGWMKTSPNAHGKWVDGINDKLDKKLKPLIRFMKLWNFMRTGGIRSFYLELRTGEYASEEPAIVYSIDFLRMLRRLRAKGLAMMQDPIGISGYVYPCSDTVKIEALSRIDTAIARAEKAGEAEDRGDMALAFEYWRLIFNDYFPKYG